ncbi:MFS general substrate transporter [Auriculariales sp. MPI-PUGE-AT-0066]|nr:MFS general substrate transporter [Auriculariales sp. MPI-PUGE-AT-0066]
MPQAPHSYFLFRHHSPGYIKGCAVHELNCGSPNFDNDSSEQPPSSTDTMPVESFPGGIGRREAAPTALTPTESSVMTEKPNALPIQIIGQNLERDDAEDKDEDLTIIPSGANTPSIKIFEDDAEYPEGGSKAWLVVLGSFCTLCATFGFANAWGAWQSLYEVERLQGTPPSTIAWIGSTQYALIFLPGLLTGPLFDMGHLKITQLFWSAILVASCFLIAECRTYWQYLLVQGFMVGISCGCLFGPSIAVLTHWFKRRRAFAFGVAAVGTSVGGTIFPILARVLERKIGFAWSLRVLGFILLVLQGISCLTMQRRLPPSPRTGGLFNLDAFSNPAYSFYVASSFLLFVGVYAVLTYIDIAAVSHGMNPDFSFYLVAITNAGSGLGRFSSGIVGDRVGATNTIIPNLLLVAVTTYAWPFATSTASTIVIAVLNGYGSGSIMALLFAPVSHMGSHSDVGRRTGMQQSILAIGALAGPPTCGAIYSAAQSYVPLGAFAGTMVVLGAALMWTAKRAATGHWVHAKF